jgi:hypothetical protein
MKLHTTLTGREVWQALRSAQDASKVTRDVTYVTFESGNSRSRPHRFELQLGTHDKHSLPEGTQDQYGKTLRVRRYKNSGGRGAESGWYEPPVWSATWHEWGWVIAEIMRRDPNAVFGPYRGQASFNSQTSNLFA